MEPTLEPDFVKMAAARYAKANKEFFDADYALEQAARAQSAAERARALAESKLIEARTSLLGFAARQ